MEKAGSTEYYDTVTQAFADSIQNGRIDAVKFGYAATLIAPLYDRIFGDGYISGHLKDDIIGHGKGLAEAAKQNSRYRYVDEMIPTMVNEKGIENIRGQWGDGVVECLWTKRALDFILRFLEYGILTSTENAIYDCALRAYEEVLKPYHGFLVSTVVALAFKFAPRREKFLGDLGFESLYSAQEKLRPFLLTMKPVITTVHQILADNECDFPDRV